MDEQQENTRFTWVAVYEAIADALAQRRNDNRSVMATFNRIRQSAYEEDTVDPFSFFAAINKVADSRRAELIRIVLDDFAIKLPVPTDFDGVPRINPLGAWYRDGKQSTNDILWKLFINVLHIADSPDENVRKEFIGLFDRALHIGNVGRSKLTQALFVFRPHSLLTLDRHMSSWLAKRNVIISPDYDGEQYLDIVQLVHQRFGDFPTLSYQAYQESLADTSTTRNDTEQTNHTRKASETDPGSTNHWLLVANPKIWSFDKLEVGKQQTYTLYNDKGHPRRIQKNMLEAKPGDLVIGYEATPAKRVTGLCRISRRHDNSQIYFTKTRNLDGSITYAQIKNDPAFTNMEFLANPNGSFFRLTPTEYQRFEELIGQDDAADDESIPDATTPYDDEQFLNEVYVSPTELEDMKALLHGKKNLILQGAPGTGKTFAAKRLAYDLLGECDDSRIEFVQFHQNTSYDDVVYGYRPDGAGFAPKPGVFTEFCNLARKDTDRPYVFIIDEINRANVSKVFGELLMCIEADHRGEAVTLSLTGEPFSVPDNVFIIGMMNTADRGLALIDYALRRRFAFFEMCPALGNTNFRTNHHIVPDTPMWRLVEATIKLNDIIAKDPALGAGFAIGHSYFCGENADPARIIRYEIAPLLREYWFDQPDKARREIATLKQSI